MGNRSVRVPLLFKISTYFQHVTDVGSGGGIFCDRLSNCFCYVYCNIKPLIPPMIPPNRDICGSLTRGRDEAGLACSPPLFSSFFALSGISVLPQDALSDSRV